MWIAILALSRKTVQSQPRRTTLTTVVVDAQHTRRPIVMRIVGRRTRGKGTRKKRERGEEEWKNKRRPTSDAEVETARLRKLSV